MTYRCVIYIAPEAATTEAADQAEGLQKAHGWPIMAHLPSSAEADVCLMRDQQGWGALWLAESRWKPLRFDYTHPAFRRRLAQAGARSEALIKALGRRCPETVLDCTAGAGEEGLVMAARGSRVRMIERDPVLATLIRDALARAQAAQLPELNPVLQRVMFTQAEAIDYLGQLRCSGGENAAGTQFVEVIYCDPMFPPRDKSALVSKTMQFFHSLLGPVVDSADLVRSALSVARRRVVVKRPAKAPYVIDAPKPHQQVQNKALRFDIYLTDRS